MTSQTPSELITTDGIENQERSFSWLVIAVILTIVLRGFLWTAGFPARELTVAVEEGSARIERKAIGELGDDVIRKAIQLQRQSRPFWTTLLAVGDFVFEPCLLIMRALIVATCFSSLAALTGRPVRFAQAFRENGMIQMYWVVGLALNVGLMVALHRTDTEVSVALFLPAGRHHASLLVFLRQFDLFAMLGWYQMGLSAWRRGQTNLLVALLVCTGLMLTEAIVRAGCALMVGGGMRLSILPDTVG